MRAVHQRRCRRRRRSEKSGSRRRTGWTCGSISGFTGERFAGSVESMESFEESESEEEEFEDELSAVDSFEFRLLLFLWWL